jgi:death-on-curing protein
MGEIESGYIPPSESLQDLIGRIQFQYLSPVAFDATDYDSLLEIVRRLTITAHLFNVIAINDYGGRAGKVREAGLCEQVLGSAFQVCFGEEAHPDPFEKASFILRGIIGGHPFEDGNKRTGFLMVYYYLDQMGFPPQEEFSVEDVVRFCFDISRGEIRDIEVIQNNLVHLWGYVPLDVGP